MKIIFTTIAILISFNVLAYECIKTEEYMFDDKADMILMESTCIANKLNKNLEFKCGKNCTRVKCPEKANKLSSLIKDGKDIYSIEICEFKQ